MQVRPSSRQLLPAPPVNAGKAEAIRIGRQGASAFETAPLWRLTLQINQLSGASPNFNLRRAVYSRPGFLTAIGNTLVLQDPEIRARNLLGPAEFGAITAPTLVLWTSDDPTADVPEGRRIASMIPGARFEVMPGCGHWPQYEDAKTFNRLHLDFLLGR